MAKVQKTCPASGTVRILAGLNNTIITVTNVDGDTICQKTAGSHFKGSRKSTPYAAQLAADSAAEYVASRGMKTVEIIVKGPGSGRELAMRAIYKRLAVTRIIDATPLPHNGVKPRKRRRV